MIRFFHFWFGAFSIFEKAILLQKIYVKFTVEKSFVKSYLKNKGSGVYDFEVRFRKACQHFYFCFSQNSNEFMRASYRWRVLGWVDFNELCPNGHQCFKIINGPE